MQIHFATNYILKKIPNKNSRFCYLESKRETGFGLCCVVDDVGGQATCQKPRTKDNSVGSACVWEMNWQDTHALGGDQEQFLVFLSFNHCSLTKQNLHIKVPVSLFQCISLLNCKQCCLRLKSFFFLKSLFYFFPKTSEF